MTDRETGSWAGQQLGRYRLHRLIGRGSMGEVYEAEDTVRERTIALKLLWPDLSHDSGFRERMQREARTAGRLQAPHVVPIHDYGEIDGHLFLDMRLIQGSDLAAVLKRSGPLNASRAVGFVQQAASALDAAHSVGVIHRDIKPANLLLTDEDFLYLVDFGIASAVGEEPLEAPKTVEGTWRYSAPELFTGNGVGRSIDIYALSAVLYECLTGAPPYRADGVQGLIEAHLNDPIPQASRTPGVSPAFDAVIARGMAKNAQDRYASAGDLAKAAQRALQLPAPARPAPSSCGEGAWGPAAAAAPQPQVAPPLPAPAVGPESSRRRAAADAFAYEARFAGRGGVRDALRMPAYWDWRTYGPRLGGVVAAVVAVIALIGWMVTRGDDREQPAAADSGVQTAEQQAAVAKLSKVKPRGYPDGTCITVAVPAGAEAAMECGRNIDSGGPVSAAYAVYGDRGALRSAFEALVGKTSVVACPGRIQSPGAWHRASTPPGKTDGMLLCGFRDNIPRIVWTSDADLLLSDVQADERAVNLDPLFAWWGTHS